MYQMSCLKHNNLTISKIEKELSYCFLLPTIEISVFKAYNAL